MSVLPENAVCYKETTPFTPENLPEKFRHNHHTKAGVWGEIRMQSGILRLKRYRVGDLDEVIEELDLHAGEKAVFAPQEPHSVAFIEDGAFTIGFHRIDEDAEKSAGSRDYPVHFSGSSDADEEHD